MTGTEAIFVGICLIGLGVGQWITLKLLGDLGKAALQDVNALQQRIIRLERKQEMGRKTDEIIELLDSQR